MELKKTFMLTAAAAMLAGAANAHDATPNEMKGKEKCFGVAKAGKNDCAWSGGSCAGTVKKDGDKGGWLLLPKGECEKINGGSLTAPK